MRMKFVGLAVCAMAVMTACQKTELTPDRAARTNLQSAVSVSEEFDFLLDGHYILRPARRDQASLDALSRRVEALGARVTGYLPQLNMMFVSGAADGFETNFRSSEASVALDVAFTRPDVQTLDVAESDVIAAPGGDNPPSIGDSEPFFAAGRMWGLDAIDAPQAWNAGYTGAGVTVAVLDEGFYVNHLDLSSNLLMAKARNFVDLRDISTNPNVCSLFPECNPADVGFKLSGFSHGTHVAGTIAAPRNNIGVIGVAPNAKVIPVKVLSDFARGGIVSWIVQGIVYAADEGAQVINLSLGGVRIKGSGKGSNLVQEGIRAYNEAIQYATRKGALVVTAAGNNGINLDQPVELEDGRKTGSLIFMPAGAQQVVNVAATSPRGYFWDRATDLDVPTPYTNHGNSAIDVAAPGGGFFFAGANGAWDGVLSPSHVQGIQHFYSYSSGTSMAAPHVAGVAALIIEKLGPGSTPQQVRRDLLGSAEVLPGFSRAFFGRGRVNARLAVQ